MHRFLRPVAAVLFLGPASAITAQDVEMLGERYGTRPPAGYYEAMRQEPGSFQFRRGMARPRLDFALFDGGAASSVPQLGLGPRSGPVIGNYSIPVVLGLYNNSGLTPPFPMVDIQAAYFGGGPGSITEYYTEVSGGRVTLAGELVDWVKVARDDVAYTVGESGLVGGSLGGGGAGNFIYDVLTLNSNIDWSPYDNDGPDGIPNSLDDDGYVDVLAVIHPTRGGECRGPGSDDRIWSHRWSLSSSVGTPFVTSTPAAAGGTILVDDYTIQPAISCSGGLLNQIGIFTHELGHAFGLPDLYDTDTSDGRHSGAGIWDLMASGSWGCNNVSPATPCHMGAWSKMVLGWVDVVTLGPDMDHGRLTLGPVETDGTVYRVDAIDGSGEYFLLENRQRIGYDVNLYSEGLLVWQIDPDWLAAQWSANRVNAESHMGVWLRQADGRNDLGNVGAGRGDAGDPFPGQTGNSAFHAVTEPSPVSFQGTFTGLTLFDITRSGDDLAFGLATRFSTMTIRADGAVGTDGLFTVNGMAVSPPATTFVSAPFVTHTIEAAAGEPIGPGERRPFLGWLDSPTAARARTVPTPIADTDFVASYGGSAFEVDVTVTGAVGGIGPGSLVSLPASEDRWFADGVTVDLEAVPTTGFAFSEWSGDLAGQSNPARFTITGPLSAGADFDLIYAVATPDVDFPAATLMDLQLEVEHGTPPYRWALTGGELPVGLEMSLGGRITGAGLTLGLFDLTFQVLDGSGLQATGSIALELVSPQIPIEQLTQPFLLSGPPLNSAQLNFLNLQGNGTAPYDVGDFRSWILANPTLPLSTHFSPQSVPSVVVVPMRPTGDER
ncbi:MAG: M6 family metalloprotease domain-containing protein [Gemmatimonadetes bacterium]|nr:M6 family metalloprotease domain-containing protein [Gemmatimonadota bacterium]MDA1103713.1 M6 family metalloprotease domain-containing protein [Gemmatimonadota bacterium]